MACPPGCPGGWLPWSSRRPGRRCCIAAPGSPALGGVDRRQALGAALRALVVGPAPRPLVPSPAHVAGRRGSTLAALCPGRPTDAVCGQVLHPQRRILLPAGNRGNDGVNPVLGSACAATPSGTFLASEFLSGKRAGQDRFGGWLGVLPKWSSGGCVVVESEQFEELLLGWVHLGAHAAGSGPATGRGVEEQGLLDAGEVVE